MSISKRVLAVPSVFKTELQAAVVNLPLYCESVLPLDEPFQVGGIEPPFLSDRRGASKSQPNLADTRVLETHGSKPALGLAIQCYHLVTLVSMFVCSVDFYHGL